MNRPKVLIVDDVEENLILLAFALKAFDVDVVKAHDGFEAETLCTEHEFLLIVLDVHMPGRTGIEAAGVPLAWPRPWGARSRAAGRESHTYV